VEKTKSRLKARAALALASLPMTFPACNLQSAIAEPRMPSIVITAEPQKDGAMDDTGPICGLERDIHAGTIRMRIAAIAELCDIGTPQAMKLVSEALGDESSEVRIAAVEGISKTSGHLAWNKIVPMLMDADSGVRRAAVLAFLDPGFGCAINSLEDAARNDDDKSIRALATEILKNVYSR